jgi:AmmeMemoRadiSam system protein B
MNKIKIILVIILLQSSFIMAQKIRNQKDTIGFASSAKQMDSVMNRINRQYGKYYDSLYKKLWVFNDDVLRFAVCPHDDYTYAGFLYEEVFSHIKAKTIIIFGVAHKAKKFGIEKKLVFDTFDKWHAPYGDINVSALRQQIMKNLPASGYIIHDSLQIEEHSVEAFIPFLQYYNKNAEIISILVPHMPFSDMQMYSDNMAKALSKVMKDNNLQWGKDIAILVSTDAVHYGDDDWGGKNYAPYGCDEEGYKTAVAYEEIIMNDCLLSPDTASARKFVEYTVQPNDWREYKWTWCGRYSVPFALMTANKLQKLSGGLPLKRIIKDYSTSIERDALKVDDIKMGATAKATLHHWVGYAVAGYK